MTRKSPAEFADFVGNRANPQSAVHLAPKRCRARISLSPGEVWTDIRLLWESLLTRHTQQAGGHRLSNAVGSHAGVGAVVWRCEVSQEQRSVRERTSAGAQRTLLTVPAQRWPRDTCSETNVTSLSINHFTLESGGTLGVPLLFKAVWGTNCMLLEMLDSLHKVLFKIKLALQKKMVFLNASIQALTIVILAFSASCPSRLYEILYNNRLNNSTSFWKLSFWCCWKNNKTKTTTYLLMLQSKKFYSFYFSCVAHLQANMCSLEYATLLKI